MPHVEEIEAQLGLLPGESGGLPDTIPWDMSRPYSDRPGEWNPG